MTCVFAHYRDITIGMESYVVVLVTRLCESLWICIIVAYLHMIPVLRHVTPAVMYIYTCECITGTGTFVRCSDSVRVFFSAMEVLSSELWVSYAIFNLVHRYLLLIGQVWWASYHKANTAVAEVIGDSGYCDGRKRSMTLHSLTKTGHWVGGMLQRTATWAQGWNKHQDAFFDVRVFNPLASSNQNPTINSTFLRHEKEKRRTYDQRAREVEHGSFTPLVFSASGGMGPATTIAYKRLATMLAQKRGQRYCEVMQWLRCRVSFSLLWSSIAAIRGSRQSRPFQHSVKPLELAIAEGHIPSAWLGWVCLVYIIMRQNITNC